MLFLDKLMNISNFSPPKLSNSRNFTFVLKMFSFLHFSSNNRPESFTFLVLGLLWRQMQVSGQSIVHTVLFIFKAHSRANLVDPKTTG